MSEKEIIEHPYVSQDFNYSEIAILRNSLFLIQKVH